MAKKRKNINLYRVGELDLFKSQELKVCMVVFDGSDPRNTSFASSGAKHIVENCGYNVDFVAPKDIYKYDLVLISLISVVDVEKVVMQIDKAQKHKIIIGGQGALNISILKEYCRAIHFGRCDGDMIRRVISGDDTGSTYYTNTVLRKYRIMQATKLIGGESAIGCRNACHYCQYSHTRKYLTKSKHIGYSHGDDLSTPEEDWHGLDLNSPGRYTTALDGMSEKTRLMVNKRITNQDIKNKLLCFLEKGYSSPAVIKVFQICGYPWENEEYLYKEIQEMRDVFAEVEKSCKKNFGRVVIMFLTTPFSPEPFTPMECSDIRMLDWRSIILSENEGNVYSGKHIEAFFLPQILGPYTLAKRIAINRGCTEEKFRNGIVEAEKCNGKVAEKYEIFKDVAGDFSKWDGKMQSPTEYLESYRKIGKNNYLK